MVFFGGNAVNAEQKTSRSLRGPVRSTLCPNISPNHRIDGAMDRQKEGHSEAATLASEAVVQAVVEAF
ncbi:hypothetical protein L596_021310 [Steinernema carpocapsae]|uniref:Uncharacterized protein n=1 Tax=Steinernema carpocapsae TaxID=34508 RepID=A0A4U5MID3_STECR|nr:hypothetical protein L596_021310 [Steinernema carpocapsae]